MTEKPLVSRRTMEAAAALFTGALGAAVIWGALEHDIGWEDSGPASGYFPFRIGVLIVLASLANLVLGLRPANHGGRAFVTREQFRSVLAFGLPMVGFVLVSLFLGLYVGAILYLAAVMVFQGGYKLWFALVVGIGVAAAMRLIFPMWFKVPLLIGPLESWLGLY